MTPQQLLQNALTEDAPHGDLTCDGLEFSQEKVLGHFIAKQDLVLSGIDFIKAIRDINSQIEVEIFFKDGDRAKKGQKLAQIFGPLKDILKIERSVLNLIGHFSGIATLTRKYVDLIKDTDCQILDTRKTTPMFRVFEKKAVLDGGGVNHRMSLSDEIMLKENHIVRLKKPLNQSLIELREKYPDHKITVECQTMEQVETICQSPIDQILLDNMDVNLIKACIDLIPEKIKSEASGNMSLERIRSVADTGVNFISVGAITHSAPVADITLIID